MLSTRCPLTERIVPNVRPQPLPGRVVRPSDRRRSLRVSTCRSPAACPPGVERPLPTQRAEPAGPGRPRLPLVPRRGHGARGTAPRRQGRMVPQPVGPLQGRRRAARRKVARRPGARTWTSPPTPTSSSMAAAPWPPSRPARCRTSCPMSWTPSARTTSAGPCPAASPRTRSSTTPPANCTLSPTSGPGTTSSTSSSTRRERSPAPPTSRSPTAR